MLRRTLRCAALAVATMSAPASAQDSTDELALAVAKVAANEASLYATRADVALIYQVASAHGRTDAQRLAWLRRHSSCVLTDRELRESETRTNCLWTRSLSGASEPDGWPRHYPRWRGNMDRRWAQLCAWAQALVAGELRAEPCPQAPETWGGEMDRARALRRGLVPVGCIGTANEGYVRSGGDS